MVVDSEIHSKCTTGQVYYNVYNKFTTNLQQIKVTEFEHHKDR